MVTFLVPSFFSTILVDWKGKLSLLKDCQLGWIGELAWTYLNLFLLLSFPPLCMASILSSNIHSVILCQLQYTDSVLYQPTVPEVLLSFISFILVMAFSSFLLVMGGKEPCISGNSLQDLLQAPAFPAWVLGFSLVPGIVNGQRFASWPPDSRCDFQGTLFGNNTLFLLHPIKNFHLGIYSHVWFSFIP